MSLYEFQNLETNVTKEIRENTDSSDTEPLTEKDDDRDSTDSTDNTEGAVTIDELHQAMKKKVMLKIRRWR